jgi:hypothetical protein
LSRPFNFLREGTVEDRLGVGLGDGKAADVDQIIRNDPKADPTFHAIVATIAATLQAMSAHR